MPKFVIELESKLNEVRLDQYGNLYYQWALVDSVGGAQQTGAGAKMLAELPPEVQAAIATLQAYCTSSMEADLAGPPAEPTE